MNLKDHRNKLLDQLGIIQQKIKRFDKIIKMTTPDYKCGICKEVIDDPFFIDDSTDELVLVKHCVPCCTKDNEFEFKELYYE